MRAKAAAAFDGGRIISDGGVALLAAIDTSIGFAAKLARLIADPRRPVLAADRIAFEEWPGLREVVRMTCAMLHACRTSYLRHQNASH